MKSRSESSESIKLDGFDTRQAVLVSFTAGNQLGHDKWEAESELRRWIHERAWWLPILEIETADADRNGEPEPEHVRPVPAVREQAVSVLVSARMTPLDVEGSPSAGYLRLAWPPAGVSPLGPIVDLEAPAGAGSGDLFVGNLASGRIVQIPQGTRLGARFTTLVGSDSARSFDLLVRSNPSCPAAWINLIQRIG